MAEKKKADNNASEEQSNGEGLSDDDVVFLHQDFTVTQSMWLNTRIIFNQVTPQWVVFCQEVLKFQVVDDLDLIS